MTDESIDYDDAIEELESILEQIESDDVGLDDLAEKVERASELVEICRGRIDDTETKVETIIDDLRDEEEEGGT